ncbi:MAG: hypothetical protein AB7K71_41125 [Polyangiaceae bacterium]
MAPEAPGTPPRVRPPRQDVYHVQLSGVGWRSCASAPALNGELTVSMLPFDQAKPEDLPADCHECIIATGMADGACFRESVGPRGAYDFSKERVDTTIYLNVRGACRKSGDPSCMNSLPQLPPESTQVLNATLTCALGDASRPGPCANQCAGKY